MRLWIATLILLAGILCSFGIQSQAATYFVKAGATGTGANWSNASGDLQAMINMATTGDEIWVAGGTYKPVAMTGATGTLTSRDVAFVLKSGVKIYGGFAGTETLLSQRNVKNNITVLSGDIGTLNSTADNAHHVVVSVNNTSETLLDGVSITAGNANLSGSVTIGGTAVVRSSGGGIYANASSTVFRNIIINNNFCSGGADYNGNGGGIYSGTSQLTIEDAVVSENLAESVTGATAGGTSGGVFAFGTSSVPSKLTLTRVTIEKNTATRIGGGMYAENIELEFKDVKIKENKTLAGPGGGIYLADASSSFTNVDFIENKGTGGSGGALYVVGTSTTKFSEFKLNGAVFSKNTTTAAGGAAYIASYTNYHLNNITVSENKSSTAGGAFFLFSAGAAAAPNKNVIISNSVFYKNECTAGTLGGGAIFISNATQALITGCTFYENNAKANGGAIGIVSNAVTSATIVNNIFYKNTTDGANPDFYAGAASTLTLSNTITQTAGTNGTGGVKVGVDPQFASTEPSNNVFLRLLAASPAVDAGDNSKIPAGITKDLAGNDRILNTTVDMGAYEYVPGSTTPTKTQTITFASNITKTYGDAKFAPGATASSGLVINYTSSNTAVATIQNGEVVIVGTGTANITAEQPGNFEYLPATSVTRTLTVNKATLTIRPEDASMIQGDPLPPFKPLYTGFVNAETQDVLTTLPTITTTATPSSADGDYPITAAGAVAANYTIQYQPGKLTIVVIYPSGKIRYVKPGGSGSKSGLTWADASDDLQAMIDASTSDYGEVWVAAGTYKPATLSGGSGASGARDVAFVLKSGVKVYGGFAGNEVRRSDRNVETRKTILSSNIGSEGTDDDNAHHVVIAVKSQVNTLLDGFTITKGNAGGTGISGSYTIASLAISRNNGAGIYVEGANGLVLDNLVINENKITTSGIGGGMYIKNSKLEVRNSSISNNNTDGSSGQGAGFYLLGEASALSEVTFSGVKVNNNYSIRTGGAAYLHNYTITEFIDSEIDGNSGTEGGAFHAFGNSLFKTQLKFTNTKISNNKARGGNGGVILAGNYVDVVFAKAIVEDNTSTVQAGVMLMNGALASYSSLTINESKFSRNKSGSGIGGVVSINAYTYLNVTNSIFNENESGLSGGAFSINGADLNGPSKINKFTNVLFYKNKATSRGGAINLANYLTSDIVNCTFVGNEAGTEGGAISTTNVINSTVLTLANSIFSQNQAPTAKDILVTRATFTLNNSYMQETGVDGVNGVIIGTNPDFVSTDPSNSEFLHLSILSAAINKGDNASVPAGITLDLAGKPRIVHTIVDMGAYEYQGPPLNPILNQTITFTGNISKTYGDANLTLNATASSGLAVTYTSSNTSVAVVTGTNTIQIVGAGTAQITANQRGNAVYLPANPVSITLTVAKAPLTIKPTDTSVEQGRDFPVFTSTYTGLVNGDTEASIATPATITTTATNTSPLGTYPLTASGAQSGKYEISYLPGTLTIIPIVRIPAEKMKMEAWFSSTTEMQVHVDMITEQTAALVLYTNTGIPVYQANVILYPGTNKFVIPADRLLSGVYIINVRTSGAKFEKKIIKR